MEFPASHTAYRIEPTGPNGDPELWQRRLDEVLCVGMPPAQADAVSTNVIAEAPPLRPDAGGSFAPSYNTNKNGVPIISLQSNPGSKAVLLLDFFGGYTPTWGGVLYSVPAGVTSATIKDLWNASRKISSRLTSMSRRISKFISRHPPPAVSAVASRTRR